MIKKLTVAFFVITVMFSSPAYPAGLPEEINLSSSDKNISLDLALEWLRGDSELPQELKDLPITVPLMKPKDREDMGADAQSQINAISYVFKQYNDELDYETANEYANIVKSTSRKFGEDPFVIAALVVVESNVRPDARSRGGDFGLMQVRWRVHRKNLTRKFPGIKTENDMFKPTENIMAGTEIFSNYRKSADGDITRAMKAYSGGSSSHWDKVNDVITQLKTKYNEFANA